MFSCKVQTIVLVALLLLLMGVSKPGQTQSKQTEKGTEQVDPDKGEQPASATKNKENRNKTPPKTVFKPTEEISEDAPVPFPVDI